MKVGITGGAGFIGGHVARELLARGHQPVIFDRTGRTIEGCETFLGDVRDEVSLTELAAHTHGIIHLAACLGSQETIGNPRPAAETNMRGTLNFLEAITQYDIPGVYIGVGRFQLDNTYNITKMASERFVRMFNKERGSRCNVVSLVNAYGPEQSIAAPFGTSKVRKIMPSFTCRALTGNPIEVYGDGEQISDMVHVTDGAKTLVAALEAAASGVVPAVTIEAGPLRHHTVNQVAEMANEAARRLGYPGSIITHLPMRPGEIPGVRVIADTDTLPLVGLDEKDFISVEEGIPATVQWYAENWLPKWNDTEGSAA